MLSQLPTDCLNEIFEHLEEDKITLHSCLLVNRLWCKIAVRVLWRNIWNFERSVTYYQDRLRTKTAILSTLIACLPNESKEILYDLNIEPLQEVITSRTPLFNYVVFCRVLSIYEIGLIIDNVFKNDQSTQSTSLNLKDGKYLVIREIIKMFMNQISSLNKLVYYSHHILNNISFIDFPGARDCLANLSGLHCSSNIYSDFFYQLSKICYNLQSLGIYIKDEISNGLKELISLQNNLKCLNLFDYYGGGWTSIIPALQKHSYTLKKLHIYCNNYDNASLPLSFVASFSNLQEIKFSFVGEINFDDFKKLQNVTFPKLKILKIPYDCPKPKNLIKFLENNGKYLTEFHIEENSDSLGLSIAIFCPNLKKLSVRFNNDELDILKTIFNNCKYLEGIKIWCGKKYLSEKDVLEVVAKYSPENFCELKIRIYLLPKLFSNDLELFFMYWNNRASQKSLNLIIMNEYDNLTEENIKIIEKYKYLGTIKKFEIKGNYEEEEEENGDHF